MAGNGAQHIWALFLPKAGRVVGKKPTNDTGTLRQSSHCPTTRPMGGSIWGLEQEEFGGGG